MLVIAARGQTGKGANRFCFLERKMALRNWRKTEMVVFWLRRAHRHPAVRFRTLFAHCVRELALSGLRFFGSFLLEEQKK